MSNEIEAASKSKKRNGDKTKGKGEASSVNIGEESKGTSTQETGVAEKLQEDLNSLTEKQKKKLKRKQHGLDVSNVIGTGSNDAAEVVDEESTKKRKKRRKVHVSNPNPDAIGGNEEHDESQMTASPKLKAANNDSQGAGVEPSSKKKAPDNESPKKSKKKRRKDDVASILPNPGEDTTLTDKARASLAYAYARLSSPDSWKFNKAHQNWLVKNFFALDAMPEKYVPIVVGYLAGCQGGVRENLMQACTKQLEPSATILESGLISDPPSILTALAGQPASASPASTDPVSKSETIGLSAQTEEAMQVRAKVLLKALGVTPS